MFIQNLRAKVGARLNGDSEAGFTLIELLVVMLILGILAAIALPAFFNQKDKAGDAKAKEYAHSTQVAIETCSTDNNGSYAPCEELSTLEKIEPTLGNITWAAGGEPVTTETTYEFSIQGSNENQTFGVVNTGGALQFPCTEPEEGGCPSTGFWDK
jgi:type IV pilus assembly protein PilA